MCEDDANRDPTTDLLPQDFRDYYIRVQDHLYQRESVSIEPFFVEPTLTDMPELHEWLQDDSQYDFGLHLHASLVPSPEMLAKHGNPKCSILKEEMNLPWKTRTGLNPDHAIGFREEAFAPRHKDKIATYSPTEHIVMPFLISEFQPSEGRLPEADTQNLKHAMVSIRAFWKLLQAGDREERAFDRYLVFSISHDGQQARIYGHYLLRNADEGRVHTYSDLLREVDISEHPWLVFRFVVHLYSYFARALREDIEKAASVMLENDIPAESPTQIFSSVASDDIRTSELELKHEQLLQQVKLLEGELELVRRQREEDEEAEKEADKELEEMRQRVRDREQEAEEIQNRTEVMRKELEKIRKENEEKDKKNKDLRRQLEEIRKENEEREKTYEYLRRQLE